MDGVKLLEQFNKCEESMNGLRASSDGYNDEDMEVELDELHHSIDIKEEDTILESQQDNNENEEQMDIKLESLHHSIDIKEETLINETQLDQESDGHLLIHTGKRDYLESLVIDVCGKVLKRNYSTSNMSEKGQLLVNKKKSVKIQQKNAKELNASAEKLLKIGQPLSNKISQRNVPVSTNIRKPSTPSADDSTTSDPIESIPGPSTSSGMLRQTEENECENCKNCICRLWRSNLTPEYATLFRLQSESMNKYLSKKNQFTRQKLKVELYPNTGIFVPENELNLALSKSNYKHRELVRQLLSIIVTDEELIAFQTAEKMNKQNSNIRNAIIGYLKYECNVSLTAVEFNDIVRRKIGQAVLNQKPKEEIQKAKINSIERAQKSRNKRKWLHAETSSSSKKTKEFGTRTST